MISERMAVWRLRVSVGTNLKKERSWGSNQRGMFVGCFCNAIKGKHGHLDTKKVMVSEKTALTTTSRKGGLCILLTSKGGQCNLLNQWTPM